MILELMLDTHILYLLMFNTHYTINRESHFKDNLIGIFELCITY